MKQHALNQLRVKSIGIDTYRENIIYMRSDCYICISEGFTALTRVVVVHKEKTIVATLNVVTSNILSHEEAGLSEIAMRNLAVKDGDIISISHLKPISSLHDVRAKVYGEKLNDAALTRIIADVTNGLYSDLELSAFITASAGDNLDIDEITGLTKAMIDSGTKMRWNAKIVLDKHCVGGLPGNRTTPIVVAIVAAAGLTIPKTSSRAITSPAGTADAMETVTSVDLTPEKIREVVAKEGGCIVWGGSVNLSPADDILIAIEKALDLDSKGQMIASVLSKKKAAGSTHVVIDIPVGKTAKVRTEKEALRLEQYFKEVGKSINLTVDVLITNGSQPVGRGIGPTLEAMDFLAVLRNSKNAPQDLKQRALTIAGALLELSGKVKKGEGETNAKQILESGKAWDKFYKICIAQGGYKEPRLAKYKKEIVSHAKGTVTEIDNRKLAKIAKLAGAPKSPSAGVYFCSPLGTNVVKGQTLFIIYSDAKGELDYAFDYLNSINDVIKLQ